MIIVTILGYITMGKDIMSHYAGKFLLLPTLAAVLAIPVAPQAVAQQERAFVSIESERGLPVRGQSRNSVKKKYGDPVSSKPAVGKPPISSWTYDDFIVYFEYSHVITTVANTDTLPARLTDIQ